MEDIGVNRNYKLRDKLVEVREIVLGIESLRRRAISLGREAGGYNEVIQPLRQKRTLSKSLVTVVIALFLVLSTVSIYTNMQAANRRYEKEVQNAKVNYDFKVSLDGKENVKPFVPPKKETGKALMYSIIYGVPVPLIICGGILVFSKFRLRRDNYLIEKDNKAIQERNMIARRNNEVKRVNSGRISRELEGVNQKAEWYLQEYMKNVDEWFPPSYGNLHAIDAFIKMVSDGEAENVKEMIQIYKQDEHNRKQLQLLQENVNLSREIRDIQINSLDQLCEVARQQKLTNSKLDLANILAMSNLCLNGERNRILNEGNDLMRDRNKRLSQINTTLRDRL